MGAISTVQARNRLAEIINRVAYAKERVILTRRGEELVAVVPVEDVRLLEDLEDRLDLDDARAALAETEATGTTAWEKIKADLGL
jgi:prevent-host-death family protein